MQRLHTRIVADDLRGVIQMTHTHGDTIRVGPALTTEEAFRVAATMRADNQPKYLRLIGDRLHHAAEQMIIRDSLRLSAGQDY